MMSINQEFKVGDRVVIVATSEYGKEVLGRIGTILEVHQDSNSLYDIGLDFNNQVPIIIGVKFCLSSSLLLIEESRVPKVGDRIFVKPINSFPGAIGIIEGISSNSTPSDVLYIVDFPDGIVPYKGLYTTSSEFVILKDTTENPEEIKSNKAWDKWLL